MNAENMFHKVMSNCRTEEKCHLAPSREVLEMVPFFASVDASDEPTVYPSLQYGTGSLIAEDVSVGAKKQNYPSEYFLLGQQ